ncbi:branched-chain amino acid ABC transporter permease [Sneathiella chinensis]|uniref:Branched-chain amino acid ABC transporter permease n=1 Tax=Sneathiella chinensis TaxID=349750 RepID=A0ABQ5U3I8_9PROT|nr:branched-chain amino acid ABC transporter permease [Sneathiella chinensis]GLQ06637.1 branched-chain amino acid ABC transporter permease [Sneathiella chinensis]
MGNNLVTVAIFAALAALPLFAGDYWTGQFTYYLIYGLFALSLSLVWGYGGILCLGQAIFFGTGGYLMAIVTKGMIFPDLTNSYLGLLVAITGPALLALALGWFLFAGRGIGGAYLAIVTLAIAVVLERLMSNWYALGGYNGLLDIPPLDIGLFGYSYELWDALPTYYVILAIVVTLFLALNILTRSSFGLVLTALRNHPDRLAFFGFSVLQIKLVVFAASAALAGLSGALFVTVDGFVSPTLIGFSLSTEVLIWVAIGGKEMLLAAFLGALLTRFSEGWLSELFGDFWTLILGLAFMASVVLLPRGLIATPLQALTRRRRPTPPPS